MEYSDKTRKLINKFWYNIEKEIDYPIAPHIRNIFRVQDIDNPSVLKDFDISNLNVIEEFVRSDAYKTQIPDNANLSDYYGRYWEHPNIFIFSFGEKSIIQQIIQITKDKPSAHWNIIETHSLKRTFDEIDECENTFSYNCESQTNVVKKSTFLKMLMESLQNNSQAQGKEGYRYKEPLKLFAAYICMIGGRALYQTLSANLPLPSISSIHRFIGISVNHIKEGVCRVNELKKFLENRNLPKYVWLSEDATGMVPKIQYDSRSNQLTGFVQSLDTESSMPVPDSFPAITIKGMEEHFKNNKVSSYLYCYMIQPLQENCPSFCLNLFGTDNSFTAEDSLKRWKYITKLLADRNIIVVGFSSDGDPRLLKAMRIFTKLGQNSNLRKNINVKIDGFHAEYFPSHICIQDTVHLAVKFKTRLFKTSITLPIGDFLVSSTHLRILVETFSKDKHLLTKKD